MIPTGEKGSINDLCKRAIENPSEVAYELKYKLNVGLNVIHTLEKYGYDKVAIKFAKSLIENQL